MNRHGAPARMIQRKPLKTSRQAVHALWGIFCHQGQVGRYKRPLFIRYITRVSFSVHTRSLAYSYSSSLTKNPPVFYLTGGLLISL